MTTPYKKAAIRTALATLLVGAWVIWFDGPGWAWAILVIYALFTFALAHMLHTKLSEIRAQADTLQHKVDKARDDD